MKTASDVIQAAGSIVHQRLLKELRYRKTRLTWVGTGRWVQVINIQLSRWNDAGNAQFTVNLGLFIEPLHTASGARPVSKNLKEYECYVRERIGELMPTKSDQWWRVKRDSDPDRIAQDLISNLERFALPWFGKMNNYEAVAKHLMKSNIPFLAAIAFQLGGDTPRAGKAMAKAHGESHDAGRREIEQLAKANGIPLPRSTSHAPTQH